MSRSAARAGAILAAGCALLLAACAGERGEPPAPMRQVGLRWEQFPDIPFPPGWKPIPGEDRVAVAIAGGAVRRLQLPLQAPPTRDDLEPGMAIQRYVAALLPDHGWTRPEGGRPDALEQHWRKGGEVLVVKAGRQDGLAVLRYRIAAAP